MLLHMPPSAHGAPEMKFDGAAEANHRIANHLSMIAGLIRLHGESLKRRAEPMSGKEVGLFLSGLQGQIESIARLHRQLAQPSSEERINIAEYLRQVVGGLVSALSSGTATDLEFAADMSCEVDPQQAFSVALIVSEVVTNSMKYAHPAGVGGRLSIFCHRSGTNLLIDVEDDGVGLPDGFDPTRDGHLGFRTIRLLAQQLGGTVSFRSEGLGTAFELRAPILPVAAPPADEMEPEPERQSAAG